MNNHQTGSQQALRNKNIYQVCTVVIYFGFLGEKNPNTVELFSDKIFHCIDSFCLFVN